jgi:hypothetical protein
VMIADPLHADLQHYSIPAPLDAFLPNQSLSAHSRIPTIDTIQSSILPLVGYSSQVDHLLKPNIVTDSKLLCHSAY